jgi:hypothetical protein
MYWIVALVVTLLGVAIHLIARAEPSPGRGGGSRRGSAPVAARIYPPPLLCAASNVVSCRAWRRGADR